MNISSIFYFSKSTSINTQYSSLWDTLKMMLFTKYLIEWKRIGRISWKFRYWFDLISSIELDIKRSMLHLSNAPLNVSFHWTEQCIFIPFFLKQLLQNLDTWIKTSSNTSSNILSSLWFVFVCNISFTTRDVQWFLPWFYQSNISSQRNKKKMEVKKKKEKKNLKKKLHFAFTFSPSGELWDKQFNYGGLVTINFMTTK